MTLKTFRNAAARLSRREWLKATSASVGAGLVAARSGRLTAAPAVTSRDLRIKEVRITPVALPDPPILAASGCHGPYFLRSIIEIVTDDGVAGIGESYGNQSTIEDLNRAAERVKGLSAFARGRLSHAMRQYGPALFAGFDMACLDAIGQATGRRVCELLGGPIREDVEFAAYMFYRYAADDPRALDDPRLADDRGRGDRSLDDWGEVRSAEAMTELAARFRDKWGFRVLKLKAGVLEPQEELKTLEMWYERFGDDVPLRIDPNGRWTTSTAISAGRQIRSADVPLEYYEDPVSGQSRMADVRVQTGLSTATNSCVSRWEHVKPAVRTEPIDVVLGDLYWYGGFGGLQALSTAARQLGWGVGYHSNNHSGICMAAMIHAGASIPELDYAMDTHYVWLPEGADLIEGNNLPIRGGRMQIPVGPGLGVRLDRDKLARAHETYLKSGMRNRVDSETMKRFEPGWKRQLF